MIDMPSSTFFTAPPHWRWLIILYFFFGGLAAGSYFLAAMIDVFGRAEDRPLARLGYYLALPLVSLCGVLLVVDLTRPLRFWHMLIERNTFEPMFKSWSPMSVGSWALLLFGFFAFLSFAAALAEDDATRGRWGVLRRARLPWHRLHRLRAPSLTGRVIAVLGGLSGFYIASYTGVLLAVTNRPIWSDTPLLGMLFVVSAASSSAALLVLLAHRLGWSMPAVHNLDRMDVWVIALELIVLVALVVSLGPVMRALLNVWGVLLVLGVVIPGLALPLLAAFQPRRIRLHTTTIAALVLVSGFLLRVIVVLSAETAS
jgi:formate-dependent nitrite reductase membrane component NrfD